MTTQELTDALADKLVELVVAEAPGPSPLSLARLREQIRAALEAVTDSAAEAERKRSRSGGGWP